MEDFWKFITDNINANPASLRLKYHGKSHEGFSYDKAITQIECRQKFGKKFNNTLTEFPHFIFPNTLAAEQATSDPLASYHASLIPVNCRIADMTAGLGIDAWHFAKKASEVVLVELDEQRVECLNENLQGMTNIKIIGDDCADFISTYLGSPFDYVFLDPARRRENGDRVFALSDCAPDAVAMREAMSTIAHTLIVKASPMLDISKTATELPGTKKIIALGTTTECKELVVICDLVSQANDQYEVSAVTICPDGNTNIFSFIPEQEKEAKWILPPNKDFIGQFLYEPFPTVMKAAPFNLLSQTYNIAPLHANTHIYIGKESTTDFPGDVLKIVDAMPYESKYIKRFSNKYPVISVTARNFDMSASDLRKKLKVRDGGNLRLFAVNINSIGKMMLICRPVK